MARERGSVLPYETRPPGVVGRVVFRGLALALAVAIVHALAEGGATVVTTDGLAISGAVAAESAGEPAAGGGGEEGGEPAQATAWVVRGRYGVRPECTVPAAGAVTEPAETGGERVVLPSGVVLRASEVVALGDSLRVRGDQAGGLFALVPRERTARVDSIAGSAREFITTSPARLVTLVSCLVRDPLHIPVTLARIVWVLLRLALLVAPFLPMGALRGAFRPFGYLFRVREQVPGVVRLGLNAAFCALVAAIWFYATEGATFHDRAITFQTLPSPGDMWAGLPALMNQTWERDIVEEGGWDDARRWARSRSVESLGIEIAWETRPDGSAGAYVCRILPKSRAEAAGLARRDLICSIDGTVLTAEGFDAAAAELGGRGPGTVAHLQGTRANGQPLDLSISIGAVIAPLGVEVAWRAAEGARAAGAVVLRNFPLSPAERAQVLVHGERGEYRLNGLLAGDAVERVGGEPVLSVEDLGQRVGAAAAASPAAAAPERPLALGGTTGTGTNRLRPDHRGRPFEATVDLGLEIFSVDPSRIDWSVVDRDRHAIAQVALDSAMIRMLGPGWTDWTLLEATLRSILRIALGFLWAAVFAVPLGILMGAFTKQRAFWNPVWLTGLYLPLPVLLPLSMMWFGTGETRVVAFLAICTFVVLLPQVIAAIEATPDVFRETALTLGASGWQIVRRVFVGVSFAEIARALRISFGVGWTWIILAEQIGVNSGLGYLIWTSYRRSFPERVYVVVAEIIILGFLVNGVWRWIERRAFPYREER